MKTNSKIATAIFAGLAAGAATWYFMSTDDEKQKWTSLVDGVKDLTDTIKQKANEKGAVLANKAEEAVDYVNNKKDAFVDYATSKIKEGKDYAADAKATAEDKVNEAADLASSKYNEAKRSVNV